ncbi:MAG: asparaginase [Acidobacteria bacterium]|nr:asparaginase [Acidobacteriota bacterium]
MRVARFPLAFVAAALFWLVAAPPAGAQPDAQLPGREQPTVRLVATGGTIANHPDGRLTVDELVALVPELDRHAIVETEQFANVASSSLTVDQWLALAGRINTLFRERSDLAGIVVTSGTDTLEETAYFLNLTVRSDRPVVVVGAMRMPDETGYDGAANLVHGVRVAAAPVTRGRGVVVVLNGEIHAAREVRKTHAQRLDTFDSGSYGLLGVVDDDTIVYYRRPGRRHTRRSEFDLAAIERLPRVDIVMTYLDAPGDLLLSAYEHGAEGLVVAASGAGGTTPGQNEAIQQLVEAGAMVVLSTRTGGGRVPARRGPIDPPAGGNGDTGRRYHPNRVSAEDLTPLKARILLMLALAVTDDGNEVQRMFRVY